MRFLKQVLDAWRSGHITTNEAMELTGARDSAALEVMAMRAGIAGRRDRPERRRMHRLSDAGKRPFKER